MQVRSKTKFLRNELTPEEMTRAEELFKAGMGSSKIALTLGGILQGAIERHLKSKGLSRTKAESYRAKKHDFNN
jgi:hypothetical protein